MTTINMRDQVMQMVNKAHADLKRDLYAFLSEEMRENEQLKNEVKDLEMQLKMAKVSNAFKLEEPKEGLPPKKLLEDSLTDEEIFRCSGDMGESELYFQETVDVLYKELELHLKKGTTKPNHRPVLLIAKDTSGSMGIWESYMAECITTWTQQMLALHYGSRGSIETRCVTFHTSAKEVTEDEFFKEGETGGTIASTGAKLLNTIADDYKYESTDDIYVLFFSDGDNLTSDNARLLQHLQRVHDKSEVVWYVEPNQYRRHSTIVNSFKNYQSPNPLNIIANTFDTKKKVKSVLKNMFRHVSDKDKDKEEK